MANDGDMSSGGDGVRPNDIEINDLAATTDACPSPCPSPKPKRPRSWDRDDAGVGEHLKQRAEMRQQDDAFQAALRAAGVPEGVSKTKADSIGVRFIPRRDDLLKSSIE